MSVVETSAGRVRGTQDRGTLIFRGIPYGQSTGAAMRFRPPVPAEPWAGTRDAAAFGDVAPQCILPGRGLQRETRHLMHPGYGDPVEGVRMSEDCLVLNVWTPGLDSSLRPVMVWLHGGGFQDGASSSQYSHGDTLAEAEDVVVVSVNHRVGLFGYTALEDVSGIEFAGSGVAGMLDLVLALEWVRDNIAAFGGNPDNVTIFGASGGGMKTATLLAMPAAEGLYHKAIIQSGPASSAGERERGAKEASQLLDAFGLAPRRANLLRTLPLGALLEFQQGALTSNTRSEDGGLRFQPIVDGAQVRQRRLEPRTAVPVLVGSTLDEETLFSCGDPEFGADMSRQLVVRKLRPQLGDEASDIVQWYEERFPSYRPYRIYARLKSDVGFRAPSVRLARRYAGQGLETYLYSFGYELPVLGGLLHASHAADCPFVFNTVDRVPFAGDNPDRFEMAAMVGHAWASFARTGKPSVPGVADWPRVEGDSLPTMLLDVEPSLDEDLDGATLDLLASVPSALFD